jgi:hypothetical protein
MTRITRALARITGIEIGEDELLPDRIHSVHRENGTKASKRKVDVVQLLDPFFPSPPRRVAAPLNRVRSSLAGPSPGIAAETVSVGAPATGWNRKPPVHVVRCFVPRERRGGVACKGSSIPSSAVPMTSRRRNHPVHRMAGRFLTGAICTLAASNDRATCRCGAFHTWKQQ